MTISSVGSSGRTYSTWTLWADAADATLSAPWTGESYNDSAFTVSSHVSLDSTADDTNFMTMTTATGQSFRDHADKLTNALRPNQSNGVLLNMSNDIVIDMVGRACIVENLQIGQTGGSLPVNSPNSGNSTTFPTLRNCIIQSSRSASGDTQGLVNAIRKNIVNCAIISKNSGLWGIQTSSSVTGKISSCTLVNSSGGGRGIDAPLGVVDNCAVFGFSHSDNIVAAGSNNNATDRANFANNSSSDQESLTTTNEIESATSGSEDLRAKSTSTLKNNGVRDQTYTNDLDIVGQSRSTTTPTIGAWEVVAGGGGGAVPILMQHYHGG